MALIKYIQQDNRIITSYHRILFIQSTINSHTSIAVLSYVDKQSRECEETAEVQPYKTAVTYEIDYVENMTVSDAYQYLKKLPEFNDAIDDV